MRLSAAAPRFTPTGQRVCPTLDLGDGPGAGCQGSQCRSVVCRAAAGVRSAGRALPVSASRLRLSAPSGRAASVTCTELARLTSADQQARRAWRLPVLARRLRVYRSPTAAGRSPPRTPRAGRRRPGGRGADAAAASGVRCCYRNGRRCPDSRCPPRTLPQPSGIRCYGKRPSGRRPLVGCSQRHHARSTWWASRLRSCSRTKVMAGRSSASASSPVSPPSRRPLT
jgi:hypothetical protein